MEWDGINKRRFIRVNFPYTIHLRSDNNVVISAYTEDVSSGGIRVVVKKKLAYDVVRQLCGEKQANSAQEYFNTTFRYNIPFSPSKSDNCTLYGLLVLEDARGIDVPFFALLKSVVIYIVYSWLGELSTKSLYQ